MCKEHVHTRVPGGSHPSPPLSQLLLPVDKLLAPVLVAIVQPTLPRYPRGGRGTNHGILAKLWCTPRGPPHRRPLQHRERIDAETRTPQPRVQRPPLNRGFNLHPSSEGSTSTPQPRVHAVQTKLCVLSMVSGQNKKLHIYAVVVRREYNGTLCDVGDVDG